MRAMSAVAPPGCITWRLLDNATAAVRLHRMLVHAGISNYTRRHVNGLFIPFVSS